MVEIDGQAVARWSQEASAASSRAEAARAEVNECVARLAAMEAQRDQARTAFVTERKAGAARREEASVQLTELQRITGELDEARGRESAMTAAKMAASAELARVSQEASAAKDRADAAEKHVAQLEQRLAAHEAADSTESQRARQVAMHASESAGAEDIDALQRQLAAQARAHEKAFDELRANAEQWAAHAKELKQRLGQAGEKILFIDARSTGEVALLRRLSSELERVKPDHELVSREMQQKLIGATMVQQLAQKGYRYNPATAIMSRVDS